MSDVIYYIAMALFLIGAIGYGVFLYRTIKDKLRLTFDVLIKKNTLVLGVFSLGIVLSLVLFTVAFYVDPVTLSYVSSKEGLVIDAGHQFLSYFFIILFAVSMMAFITAFFYYFFLNNFEDKFRKWFKIIMYSSIPLMFVFFILMSEGNAPYLTYPLCNSLYIGKHGIKFINTYSHREPYFIYESGSGYVLDGGISIAFYAIFILSGALLVFALSDHLTYKYYGKHGLLTTCFLIAFPMGLIGARLWYVVLDISKLGGSSHFVTNPISILYFNEGGLGIMGGAILGIISGVGVMLYFKYIKKNPDFTKMNYLRLADFIVPAILIAQAIGRFGNFFNAEVHGNEIPFSSLSWLPTFMQYNYQFNYATQINDLTQAYLPLSIMETITNLTGYFVIYFGIVRGLGKYHAPGSGVGWYLVWYGATRAFLEPLRYGEFEYQASVDTAYIMIAGGLAIVAFFIVFKILKEKKLWIFKNSTFKDEILVNEELSNKELLRNVIILGSFLLIMIIVITVLFNIW